MGQEALGVTRGARPIGRECYICFDTRRTFYDPEVIKTQADMLSAFKDLEQQQEDEDRRMAKVAGDNKYAQEDLLRPKTKFETKETEKHYVNTYLLRHKRHLWHPPSQNSGEGLRRPPPP